MKTAVLALFFVSVLRLNWCFAIVNARRAQDNEDGDSQGVEFPFAQAKVKYHRSRYCITAFGETNCVRTNEEPGDAAKIAKLYYIMLQNYEESTALRAGKGKPDIENLKTMSENLDHNKLSEIIKATKMINKERLKKVSQRTSPNKLRQKVDQKKLSQLNEPSKLVESEKTKEKQQKLAQRIGSNKINHKSNVNKLSHFINPYALSKEAKQLSQKANGKKLSLFGKPRKANDHNAAINKPRKLSHEIKPLYKFKETVKLSKVITQKPKWHVAPVPRGQF